jgi:hypothetical protein
MTALWAVLGIVALLWTIPCGAVANWGQNQGISFRKVFLFSLFLTPLAGLIFVRIARSSRGNPALAQTATRG